MKYFIKNTYTVSHCAQIQKRISQILQLYWLYIFSLFYWFFFNSWICQNLSSSELCAVLSSFLFTLVPYMLPFSLLDLKCWWFSNFYFQPELLLVNSRLNYSTVYLTSLLVRLLDFRNITNKYNQLPGPTLKSSFCSFPHLSKQQLHPSGCSGPEPQNQPRILFFSYLISNQSAHYMIQPLKCIQNLTTSHYFPCYHLIQTTINFCLDCCNNRQIWLLLLLHLLNLFSIL